MTNLRRLFCLLISLNLMLITAAKAASLFDGCELSMRNDLLSTLPTDRVFEIEAATTAHVQVFETRSDVIDMVPHATHSITNLTIEIARDIIAIRTTLSNLNANIDSSLAKNEPEYWELTVPGYTVPAMFITTAFQYLIFSKLGHSMTLLDLIKSYALTHSLVYLFDVFITKDLLSDQYRFLELNLRFKQLKTINENAARRDLRNQAREFLGSSRLSFPDATDHLYFGNFDENLSLREIIGLRLIWENGQKTPSLLIIRAQVEPLNAVN